MKKLLIFLILGIFLIGFTSCLSFDNKGVYDNSKKEITIKNNFGYGETIGKIKLISDLNINLPRGYQKVAEFEINSNTEYKKVIKQISLYDISNNLKEFNRKIDIKYLKEKLIDVKDYKEVCSYSKNNSKICEKVVSGTHKETEFVWENFTNDIKINEKLTIGIFTDVKKGDNVEWIPEVYGVKINEWATWTESLSSGLRAYYKFEETTGVVKDSMGLRNGTNNGATRGATGKIGNAYDFDGAGDNVTIAFTNLIPSGTGDFSISLWAYHDDHTPTWQTYVSNLVSDDLWFAGKPATANVIEYIGGVSGNVGDGNGVNDGAWYHLVLVRNGTTNTILYVNNISSEKSAGGNVDASNVIFGSTIDEDSYMDGILDEIGIWNRTLSPSEVSDLWNEGNGITYTVVTPSAPSLIVTMVNPINNLVSSNSTINFNASITPEYLNLTNATFYVWNQTALFNKTKIDITGNSTNSTNININGIPVGSYTWNVYGCGTNESAVICNYSLNNYSFSIGATINEIIYNNFTYETAKENFYVNLSVLPSTEISLIQLVYNGTNYTINNYTLTYNSLILNKEIDISLNPLNYINSTKYFFLRFIYAGNSMQEVGNYSQKVNSTIIVLCNSTYNITSLNFTLIDEETFIPIAQATNPTNYQATFNYWLGDGSIYKNYSHQTINSTGSNNFSFCIIPTNRTLKVNLNSIYSAYEYSESNYYLKNASINNVQNNLILYLLKTSSSTKFYVTVKQGITFIDSSIVSVSKFFVGEGIFKTIAIKLTDDNGEFPIYADLDSRYQFSITKNGTFVGLVEKVASCSSAPCSMEINLGGTVGNIWEPYDDIYAQNILSNLSYSPTTKIVTYSFIDISGLAHYFRLEVHKISMNQTIGTSICDTTAYTASGTITCNMTGQDGDFFAYGYISRSPEKIDKFISFLMSENFVEELGFLGLFLSFTLIVTIVIGSAAISRGNPSTILVFLGLTILLLKIATLFPFSWTVVVSLEALIIFMLWHMET